MRSAFAVRLILPDLSLTLVALSTPEAGIEPVGAARRVDIVALTRIEVARLLNGGFRLGPALVGDVQVGECFWVSWAAPSAWARYPTSSRTPSGLRLCPP